MAPQYALQDPGLPNTPTLIVHPPDLHEFSWICWILYPSSQMMQSQCKETSMWSVITPTKHICSDSLWFSAIPIMSAICSHSLNPIVCARPVVADGASLLVSPGGRHWIHLPPLPLWTLTPVGHNAISIWSSHWAPAPAMVWCIVLLMLLDSSKVIRHMHL